MPVVRRLVPALFPMRSIFPTAFGSADFRHAGLGRIGLGPSAAARTSGSETPHQGQGIRSRTRPSRQRRDRHRLERAVQVLRGRSRPSVVGRKERRVGRFPSLRRWQKVFDSGAMRENDPPRPISVSSKERTNYDWSSTTPETESRDWPIGPTHARARSDDREKFVSAVRRCRPFRPRTFVGSEAHGRNEGEPVG